VDRPPTHVKDRLHSAHFRGREQGSEHESGQHEYVNTSFALTMLLALLPFVPPVKTDKLGSASSILTGSTSAIACLQSAGSVTTIVLLALCLSITKKRE